MTRSQHQQFAHVALRERFFGDPNGTLALLTSEFEKPLIQLWNTIGADMASAGATPIPSSGLSLTLVTLATDTAVALVSLPPLSEGEGPLFIAMVAASSCFDYLTLESFGSDPDEGYFVPDGRLVGWTAEGLELDTGITVPPVASEFLFRVKGFVRCNEADI